MAYAHRSQRRQPGTPVALPVPSREADVQAEPEPYLYSKRLQGILKYLRGQPSVAIAGQFVRIRLEEHAEHNFYVFSQLRVKVSLVMSEPPTNAPATEPASVKVSWSQPPSLVYTFNTWTGVERSIRDFQHVVRDDGARLFEHRRRMESEAAAAMTRL